MRTPPSLHGRTVRNPARLRRRAHHRAGADRGVPSLRVQDTASNHAYRDDDARHGGTAKLLDDAVEVLNRIRHLRSEVIAASELLSHDMEGKDECRQSPGCPKSVAQLLIYLAKAPILEAVYCHGIAYVTYLCAISICRDALLSPEEGDQCYSMTLDICSL